MPDSALNLNTVSHKHSTKTLQIERTLIQLYGQADQSSTETKKKKKYFLFVKHTQATLLWSLFQQTHN